MRSLVILVLALLTSELRAQEPGAPVKVGIIGLDTSHVIAFTRTLNNQQAKPEVAGFRVVAAFPGGSADIPDSRDRVPKYTAQLKEEFGVEIVDSIDALLNKVDAVLLESLDGRPHLEQIRPVLKANKPVFIDKPVAGSLRDAVAIFDLAKQTGTPCFSCSALRFSPGIVSMRNNPKVGAVLGCTAFSPCSLEEHHPDLFWYGVHGVETLFTIMGPGCVSVTRVQTPDAELVTGVWKDGRVGTYRGIRKGRSDYGALVFGAKGIERSGSFGGYEPLVVEICRFFRTRKAPVAAEETLEMFAFMEAADESKRQGGKLISLDEVLRRARSEASSKP